MIKNFLEANGTYLVEIFTSRKVLRCFYVFFALITGMFCVILTPPFQVADEPAHFMRVLEIADNELVGVKYSRLASGTMLSQSVPVLEGIFDKLALSHQSKVTPEMLAQAMAVPWSGNKVSVGLSNTVIYPPTSYIGAVGGVWWARFLHSSLLGTFYLARVGNLLADMAVSVLALYLMPQTGIFLLVILALPMSISLMSSCSQDGMVLALAALGIACTLNGLRQSAVWQKYILACLGGLAFGCVAAAKAPYLVMACVPVLFMNRDNVKYVITSCAMSVGVFSIWVECGIRPVLTELAPQGASAAGQLSFIREHPILLVESIFNSLETYGNYLVNQAIGVLGWLDLPLSSGMYRFATILLGCTFTLPFLCMRSLKTREKAAVRVCGLVLIMLAAVAGIFMALYVTWTPVGKNIVDGVQGRYFLPIVMLGTLYPFLWKQYEMSEDIQHSKKHDVIANIFANCFVVAFMVCCYAAVCQALSYRYW